MSLSTETPIQGLRILQRERQIDSRGTLERLFAADELAALGNELAAVHVNLTTTNKPGTVKGMHLQHEPFAETKIVTCIRGRIFDAAVDLRPGSQTFGRWFGVELSQDEPLSLLIPEGCAHGMQCLETDSLVHYVHSARYAPEAEAGVNPLDPDVALAWPLEPRYLSKRDQSLPWLADLAEAKR